MDFPIHLVEQGFRDLELPIHIDEQAKLRLIQYAGLLVAWNEKINLTAITQPEEIAVKHFLDSAVLLKYMELPTAARVIDVGTGAGFPGLVLKILRPDLRLTLLDSLQKRLRFLENVTGSLGLSAELVHARAEEGGRNPLYREAFELATARAVARLPLLAEYCLPFVKAGGLFCALKGPDGERECGEAAAALGLLGGGKPFLRCYTLPGGDSRSIIVCEKTSQTPARFPRNPAQIAKKPLG
ncbi:MAG: 16S rRNA (guanine(527)-N(7))-methyltransferase RsmG [Clostridiales bacterium]|nr:16S rRNA (guanine(527)-N(7))-methyltransferase RsmG [Clostridiales bacterium]